MNDELARTDRRHEHRPVEAPEHQSDHQSDHHAEHQDDSSTPIAGVGLELYARIVRSIAMMNHDLSMLAPMAALHGVGNDDWVTARDGWNRRIASDPAVSYLFRELYDAG